ncbi:DNA primase [Vibrio plantisponsor]|uniref:DNA primase n=1 Tax=Vibrio plantisponsor TaxID=664643 RepID=A0ABU4IHN2_9VIBR|nr:DNA primase [Vibrio plantisponsor]MDW6018073.1 DNA primase [Vibrio plantisponsor]NNM39520.1 DNA primase [Vibrio plantisponsor]
MAGQIPRSFIDDLLARLDIVDVIDARVKLKKKGKNYGACCPFHNEKTPSFSVSQEKQFYHCFGCGVHGNAIDFMMEYERLEFPEAIEELASSLGLEVPREERSNSGFKSNTPKVSSDEKRNLYDLMGSIAQFYRQQLKVPANRHAIEYLKNRGLSGEIVQKFGIGYVADEWDLVRKNFGQQKHAQDMLVSGGMLIENDNGKRYDRFRGRVMFPIRDRRGRVIGFGGRVIGEGTPKYLNSPETPIFHKGKELYGLYEVLQAYREPPQILVVEGYMDVVALAQYGIDYSVASLGTSTTGDHIQTLFRQTNTIICCYDGDRAGREAARRAMENALEYLNPNKILKVLFLPDGEDPDSFVRKYGKDGLEAEIDNSLSLIDFLLSEIKKDAPDGDTTKWKVYVATNAAPLLNKTTEASLKAYIWSEILRGTGWSDFQLEKFLNSLLKTNETKPQPHKEIKRTPMRDVIALLLQNPSYADMVPDLSTTQGLEIPGLKLLTEVLEKCRQQPHIKTGQLLEHWRGTKTQELLSRLASWEIPFAEDQQELFYDSLDKILAQCVEKQIEQLLVKERNVGLSSDEKRELVALMLEFKA